MELRELKKNEIQAYTRLLKDSFPPDERREDAEQRRLFERSAFHTLVPEKPGVEYNDWLSAFVSYWEFEEFCYLEHFAVSPRLRGQGLGQTILAALIERLNQPLALEAEPPGTGKIAARRVAFYERSGFILNHWDYIQPAYSADKSPVPLVFMTCPSAIDIGTFRRYRDVIYREAYGVIC